MDAVNLIGAVMMWGGIATALYLFERLRHMYGRTTQRSLLGVYGLFLLNTFLASEGSAFLFCNDLAELTWHRTLAALIGGLAVIFILTAAIMFGPLPPDGPQKGSDPHETKDA
jgi:hypothetical protein